jgi:hypothetical protein
MPWFSRADGDAIPALPSLRRVMPHLMPGRNEAAVFLDQRLRVERTLAWIDEQNRALAPEDRVNFFHVVLCALARVLHERPQLNRFIVGRRVYQRREVAISFAVKRTFDDDGGLATVRVTFGPRDSPQDVARKARAAVSEGRSDRPSAAQKEMDLASHLPGAVIRALLWLQRALDARNLLPAALTRQDPLYASLFAANLGSIGLDAPFHHLYEYGTVPIFAALGRIAPEPVVDDGQLAVGQVAHLRYTLDERIADGFYCARSLELVRQWIEDPDALLSL